MIKAMPDRLDKLVKKGRHAANPRCTTATCDGQHHACGGGETSLATGKRGGLAATGAPEGEKFLPSPHAGGSQMCRVCDCSVQELVHPQHQMNRGRKSTHAHRDACLALQQGWQQPVAPITALRALLLCCPLRPEQDHGASVLCSHVRARSVRVPVRTPQCE